MSESTASSTSASPPKKTSWVASKVEYLIQEPMFYRIVIFGIVSTYITNYLYTWADFLRTERSYTRDIWPFEYYPMPDSEQIQKVINKYDYLSHTDMAYMLVIGLANVFFYAMFYCDLLTLTLPKSIQSLDALPFLLAVVDVIENACYFRILLVAPDFSSLWNYTGYITAAKTGLTYFILWLIAMSLITFPIRYCLRSPKATEKKKQQ